MEKLLKGRGILRRGDAVSLGIFSIWGMANLTTVTFNCILGHSHSVPISIECKCQSQFSLYSFSSCLQGVYFLFTPYRCYFLFQSENVVLIYS